MNYDDYAATYAHARGAVAWVVRPLLRAVRRLPEQTTIIEIGCGTGNYIIALSEAAPPYRYTGFDVSAGMLEVARSRSATVEFLQGNAEERFPYPDQHATLMFAVDVIHHIMDPGRFFHEAGRVLAAGGRMLIVTDSEANIRARSLTRYFPEILAIELARYPKLEELHARAAQAGLDHVGAEAAEGMVTLDDDFIARLEAKCSSAMRLMPEEAHRRGVARVRQARARGEAWFSCYTVLQYSKR